HQHGGPFAPAGTKAKYGRDRQFDVQHIKIELTVNFDKKGVSGAVSHTLTAINDGLKKAVFDARELNIKKVWLASAHSSSAAAARLKPRPTKDNQQLLFDYSDDKLTVFFPKALKAGQEVTVRIEYTATPRRGLWFVIPDKDYPGRTTQVWSQGEDEDNRFWIPCWDYPNEKATSEMTITVPEKMTAVSNGELLKVKHDAPRKTKTFHWYEHIPHVSYLITLAAGEFVEVRDEWEGIPVTYYVAANRKDAVAEARRSFGNTPKMIDFFSKKTGVRYPYEKYAQVCATEFIFGGMENTSATTQTDLTLHDERAHLDFSSDPLVAHELAHQWWGDLLTCKDWSHGWLNEGFATYFEALWAEHDLGLDEFRYKMFQNAQNYLDEDSKRYRRPIVTKEYVEPFNLFDKHLYEKGALVLHMIRRILGDAQWWKAMNHYCTTYREQCVETPDLIKAIADSTGHNLEWFFDQWVYQAGHPDLKVAYSWDDEKHVADIAVSQTQKVDDRTPLFRLPLDVVFHFKRGAATHRVEFSEQEQTIHTPLKGKPRWVAFDPGNWILKTIESNGFSRDMLTEQMMEDGDCMGRIRAVHALAKEGSPPAVAALRTALLGDKFWGVQAECARALGKVRGETALTALIEGLKVRHPKARRAVVQALGSFRDDSAANALASAARKDASYFVEADATWALGKTRSDKAFNALALNLKKPTWNQTVERGALAGLSELGDARGVTLAAEYSKVGKPYMLRVAALSALAKLGADLTGPKHRDILDHLTDCLSDPNYRVRLGAVSALADLKDDRAIPSLCALLDRELDARIKQACREAVRRIRESREHPE
ncbi:MAG: M1 family aminopeptidase, partial [bacterium]